MKMQGIIQIVKIKQNKLYLGTGTDCFSSIGLELVTSCSLYTDTQPTLRVLVNPLR